MARGRDFDALSEAQLVVGRTERRVVTAEAGFRPASARSMAQLLDTIQHVAEAATGERSFLHLQPREEPRRRDPAALP